MSLMPIGSSFRFDHIKIKKASKAGFDSKDTVLARFDGGFNNIVRFVKRDGVLYMVGDIEHVSISGEKRVYTDRIKITNGFIIEILRRLFENTITGKNELYEIWVNSDFYNLLGDDI